MKNIMITGATSFLGCALTNNLLNKGYSVYAVTRKTSRNLGKLPKNERLKIIYADLAELESVVDQVPKCDAFFHLGWDGIGINGRADVNIQKLNIENALKAIDVAKNIDCTCFFEAGSQSEYGYHDGFITEQTSCNPVIEYGKAKLQVRSQGYDKCRQVGLKYIHLRIFSVYGPNDHQWTLISSLVDKLCKNEDVALSSCEQKWNYMYIDDAVESITRLYEYVAINEDVNCETYNIGSEDTRTLKEFVEEAKTVIGGTGNLLYGSIQSNKPLSIRPDISRLLNAIEWHPKVNFNEGIRRMIEYKRWEEQNE